jgi:hypothetical protein
MTADNIPDIGPAPPAWALPGARPGWDSVADADGAGILDWVRDIGQVWICCSDSIDENGEWVRTPARIGFCEPRDGLDAAGARRLAGDLLAAADILDG